MMANVDNAVTNGRANVMSGLMVADWGDGGHPNPWIVSVPAGKANFRACFEPEYRRLWLRQNRVGGLDLSLVTVFGR